MEFYFFEEFRGFCSLINIVICIKKFDWLINFLIYEILILLSLLEFCFMVFFF